MASMETPESSEPGHLTRVEEKSLSTDSMVTVRLSEVKDIAESLSEPESESESQRDTELDASGEEQTSEALAHITEPVEVDESKGHEQREEEREPQDPSDEEEDTKLERMEIQAPESARISAASAAASRASTASSASMAESASTRSVDWEGLEKTEEQEPKDETSDESTALLLARLEQENAALAANSRVCSVRSPRTATRPPSVQHLNKLVHGPQRQSLRYSQMPAPPMTELEFWAALVSDYVQTAQRLPTLTANKIRGGVPPPLRGVVWPSIAGANDADLMQEFQRLSGESSPYEGLIGKDVGRSFPNVEMFRDPNGDGQRMLGRVLKCFSLYDDKIGYCQGLGFVVGPLLMHMSDVQAFCVLVRLMEHYDLRSCYLPDLAGLHLRIYQFQQLLTQHIPEVAAHLEELKVEPLYVSQWFLSFFAVTCPLPMMLRIYDVILSEGATETLMRVALSLMQRNSKKILACKEFEDAMHLLLSRSLWDTYHQQADDLVADFASFTSLVSRATLQSLEETYRTTQTAKTLSLKATATQFLGRFWGGAMHGSSKSANNLSLALPSRPVSGMKRSPSKQSLASTLNSHSSVSDASTLATEVSSRKSDPTTSDSVSEIERSVKNHPDRGLHSQIEDLLTALSDMQRQQAEIVKELQKEREEREEDKDVARNLLFKLKSQASEMKELLGDEEDADTDEPDDVGILIERAEFRFSAESSKRISIVQTKHQLRDSVAEWKSKHETEVQRCKELTQRLDSQEMAQNQVKEQLREARARIQDCHKTHQRLEKTIKDLRGSKTVAPPSPADSYFETSGSDSRGSLSTTPTGLREFRLGRSTIDVPKSQNQQPPPLQSQPSYSKRSSSLSVQAILTQTENQAPVPDESLLLELVNSKTAEAVARQELEEVKAKLDSLRKMLNLSTSDVSNVSLSRRPSTNRSDGSPGHGASASLSLPRTPLGGETQNKSASPASSLAGSFFSGWGKRSVSNLGI